MLPKAWEIHEPQIDGLNVFFPDKSQYFFR